MKNYILIFFSIVLLSSCAAAFKSNIKDDGEQIPPEIGKEKTAMLVVRYGKKGHDKWLDKNFKKYYKGEYVIVDEKQALSQSYNDINKYRYWFGAKQHYQPGYGSGKNRMPPTYSYSYYITDLKTGKRYATNLDSGLFSKLMKAYLAKVESVRSKNAS